MGEFLPNSYSDMRLQGPVVTCCRAPTTAGRRGLLHNVALHRALDPVFQTVHASNSPAPCSRQPHDQPLISCGVRLLVPFTPASHDIVVVDGPVAARHDIAWSYTSPPSCQRRWRVRSLPVGVPRRYPGARPVSTLVILIRARPCGFLNSESDLDSCIRSRSCLQPTAQVRYCARTLISEEGGCNLAIHLCNLQHDINTQG